MWRVVVKKPMPWYQLVANEKSGVFEKPSTLPVWSAWSTSGTAISTALAPIALSESRWICASWLRMRRPSRSLIPVMQRSFVAIPCQPFSAHW